MPDTVRNWGLRVLDILLPPLCVLCGMPAEASNLCPSCDAELPRNSDPCLVCGLPLPRGSPGPCGACLRRLPPWDRAVTALVYRPPADWLVRRFKFNRDFACGRVLASAMLEAVRQRGPPWPDLVVPVPLHRYRQLLRTFNQAELMAGYVGSHLSVPLRQALLRVRRTTAQSGLDAAARRRNTRGAFALKESRRAALQGARVALVDDVLTTGATLSECARLLQKAGAADVTVWVAARAPAP